jgi:phenylacetate-CoA ligase
MDNRKLNELVQFVRKSSPFYGELYMNLPEVVTDISALPVVDHTSFWNANTVANNRVLTAPLTEAVVLKTGGTTGAPKFACYTRQEWGDFVSDIGQAMASNGLRNGHRVANLFYGGELYASFMLFQESLSSVSGDSVRLPMGSGGGPESAYKVLADFSVEVILGTPTTICRVASHMLEKGHQLPSVEFVLFAGEPIFDDQRRLLAAAFPNVEICAAIYGSVDAGVIGRPRRGPDQRSFLAPAHDAVLEVVDDATGEPIREPGRSGRLYKTDLRRRLLPIIRYPVGDRAEWVDYEAGLYRLMGRDAEGVRIGPVSLFTEDIRSVVSSLDAADAIIGLQLVAYRSDGVDGLRIRLAARPDFADTEATAAELVEKLGQARPMIAQHVAIGMIHPVTVEWKRYNELDINSRSGKLRLVVDERPTD